MIALALVALTLAPNLAEARKPVPFVGEVRWMSFQFAPPDWLVCDGSEHKVSDCEQLAKVIGESLKSGLGVFHNAHSIDKLLTYCS